MKRVSTPTAPTALAGRLDPRVARTRELLQDALLQLARERGLDEISVADIADRATVNRSTFYQHYPDKETLLADALDAQAALAGADLSGIDPQSGPDVDPPEIFVRYARHVTENVELYRRALGDHGSPVATTRLLQRLTAMAAAGIEMYGWDDGDGAGAVPADIAAGGLAGSLLGVIVAWLRRDPLDPPEVMARWAWSTLTRGRPA